MSHSWHLKAAFPIPRPIFPFAFLCEGSSVFLYKRVIPWLIWQFVTFPLFSTTPKFSLCAFIFIISIKSIKFIHYCSWLLLFFLMCVFLCTHESYYGNDNIESILLPLPPERWSYRPGSLCLLYVLVGIKHGLAEAWQTLGPLILITIPG